jgi:glycerol uptake facilitator-like aquaporin
MSEAGLPTRLLAEAFGTCALIATVIGSGIMGVQLAGGNLAVALLANTLATVAMLMVLITLIGPVSGAHFNPCVSLVMALQRHLGVREAMFYSAAQLAGAALGAVIVHAMFDLPLVQISTHIRSGPGQWLAEAVAAFGLIGVILCGVRRNPQQVPVLVALYIGAAYWFTASTSFANPAAAFGRMLSDSFAGIAPASVPGFVLAEVAGALLAFAVFKKR